MTGKRDTADAIRYFLNRYRAEALGEPVAFEEVGRAKRYTFVGEVPGLRPALDLDEDRWRGSIGDVRINGEPVDADLSDLSVSVSKPGERAERDAFDRLYDAADETVSVVDERVTPSTLRDAIHALRSAGYADERLSPVSYAEGIDVGERGAIVIVGSAIEDDIREYTRDLSHYHDGEWVPDDLPNVDGYAIKASKHAPAGKGVVVDVAALAPPTPGTRHATPFVVRDPSGVVAIERVETDFEWAEGGR